jgi:hypothetical protein
MFMRSQLEVTQISKLHLLIALMKGNMNLYQLLAKAKHNCHLDLRAEILVNFVHLVIF